MITGDQRIVFLKIRLPEGYYGRRPLGPRGSTPYRRELRRLKGGRAPSERLKDLMNALAQRGDSTATQWFENKRRTG